MLSYSLYQPVRKIHIPWNREAGFGAISWDGTILFNESILDLLGLKREEIERCIFEEKEEIEKRLKMFRGDKPFPDIQGKTAIVVDDGIASGFTMLVAISSLKKKEPKRIIVAVPTASMSAIQMIRNEADKIFCLNIREGRTFAVADAYKLWYDLENEFTHSSQPYPFASSSYPRETVMRKYCTKRSCNTIGTKRF
jgi:predicted phosphoribosyltransferase